MNTSNREMKDSGVEWIGEIPKEWKTPKLKHLLILVNGRAYKDDEFEESGTYPVLRVGNLFTNPKWYYSSLELEPSKYCDSGDLLYAWSASYGPYIWNGGKVIYHYHIWKVIVDNKYMKKYAFYVMQSLTHSISSQSHGTAMTHVTMDAMNNQCIPYPQKSEQIRISDFLDRECGEIDAVMEKTRFSIEEYKKLKQAVITQAVTKGIRPNRPMKDSGIAWIGQIPEDWIVDKIVRLFETIGSGTTPKSNDENCYGGAIPWIQSGDINGSVLRFSKNCVSSQAVQNYSALKIYDAPYIVIAMYGASIGNLSVSKISACVNQACCVLSNAVINLQFAFYALKSAREFLVWKAVGGGQPNISQEIVKSTHLPRPPLDEQQEIAAYLDTKCAELDTLIAKKQQFLTELETYKKSLIYEYVTGKREVS